MENKRLRGRPRAFTDTEKRCGRCKSWFPHSEFDKDSRSASGLGSYCRDCKALINKRGRKQYAPIISEKKHAYYIKGTYGLSTEEYERLWIKQNRACGICERPLLLYGRTTHIDHDHNTGKIRGLLCPRCNWALGVFQDNIFGVEKALNYLKNSIS